MADSNKIFIVECNSKSSLDCETDMSNRDGKSVIVIR